MSKFSTTLHLPPGVADDEVDQIGRAVLLEQARLQKKTITGGVERTYDELVVGVSVIDERGTAKIQHVPVTSPLAEGRTDPDARVVTWQTDVESITTDPAVVVVGDVRSETLSHATLPPEVTAAGGMVSFRHGLESDDAVISVFDAQGASVNPEFAIEIKAGEHQLLLLPGAQTIQAAILDEETK